MDTEKVVGIDVEGEGQTTDDDSSSGIECKIVIGFDTEFPNTQTIVDTSAISVPITVTGVPPLMAPTLGDTDVTLGDV